MVKKIYLFLLMIFALSLVCASPYSFNLVSDNPYSSNTNYIATLKWLSDTNINTPLDAQTILYNFSSGLWYNAYLNDSSHSVNNSVLWNGHAYGDEGHWGINGNDIYYNDGNVGIGTTTPKNTFNVMGDGNFTGTLFASDLNLTSPASINFLDVNNFIASISATTLNLSGSIRNGIISDVDLGTISSYNGTLLTTAFNLNNSIYASSALLVSATTTQEVGVLKTGPNHFFGFGGSFYNEGGFMNIYNRQDDSISIGFYDNIIGLPDFSFGGFSGSTTVIEIKNITNNYTTQFNYDIDINGTVNANDVLINGSSISAGSLGAVTGSGTSGYLSAWNGTTSLNNSPVFTDGTNVGIGTTSPVGKLNVMGDINISSNSLLDIFSLNFSNGDTITGNNSILITIDGQQRLLFSQNDSTFNGDVNNVDDIPDWSRFSETNLNNGTNAIAGFTAKNLDGDEIKLGITARGYYTGNPELEGGQGGIFLDSNKRMGFSIGYNKGYVWRNDPTDSGLHENTTNVLMTLSEIGYLNLTGNLSLSNNFLNNVGVVNFDTNYSNGYVMGRLNWDSNEGTMEIGTDIVDVTTQVGRELLVKGVNKEGDTLLNGEVVYISGVQGNRPVVSRAFASNASKALVLGMITANCDDNQECYITTFGAVNDLNTSMYSEGDKLYLCPDVPGGVVTTAPEFPNFIIKIGTVTTAHQQQGRIELQVGIDYTNGVTFSTIGLLDDIVQVDYKIRSLEGHANLNGKNTFNIFMNGTEGIDVPHLILQPGGAEQAGIWVRSGIVAPEAINCLNTTNRTDSSCYANEGNFTWNVDFNTSLSNGADWGITGDLDVVKNSYFGGNITLGQKITFTLGEIIDNLVDGWIRITGNLNVTGNFTGNFYYGGLTGSDIGDVAIASSGVYYNVTNVSAQLSNGFAFNESGAGELTVQVAGVYEIKSGWSFSGGVTNEYHLAIGINFVKDRDCHGERKVGTGGDVGSASTTPCFKRLNVGDTINLMIENLDSASNPTVYDIGLTMNRIGD